MYYLSVWHPHLMKDITEIEQLQCRATKYILQDYISDYKTRLTKLQLLPVMYISRHTVVCRAAKKSATTP